MTSSSPRAPSARQIAGKVVHDVLSTDIFSNRRLSELLDQSQLETRDRNFCAELVYGTLRWSIPLEESLRSAMNKPGKIPPRVMAHWLVAAYQLQHLAESIPPHAAVNEAVSLVKRLAPGLSGLTNAILRKLGSPKHQMLQFDKATETEIAKAFGIPESVVACITKTLPKETWRQAVEAFNQRPQTFFRAFSSKDMQDDFLPHPFVPGAFFARNNQDLTEALHGPHFVVQDPASQVAALLVAAQKGERVVDMCAAPGMKSLILKVQVGKDGTVVAVDINDAKQLRMKQNMRRLNLPLEIVIKDARKLCLDETLKHSFDAVLLDAPCSGLGTIRRHPEIRRRQSKEKIEEIAILQRELLSCAAQLVKKGGTLVYSVCSPLAVEGRDQIEWFLHNHKDFRADNPRNSLSWLPENAVTSDGHVALWPHLHDSDAFFAARLVKS